tara:strand:+ start:4939 stop:5751 length:813 start_codon:yes stop_codon:yes gene_type:complete
MKDLIRKILKEEKNLLATSAETLVRNLPTELKDILFSHWDAKQNPKWHPEGNTLKHILVVIKRAYHHYPNDPNMIMSALFHDLGKMDTYAINPKTSLPTAYGHEKESVEYVEKFRDWIESFEGTDVDEIKYLVKNHMKIKPSTWEQMRDKKKEPIEDNPAFDKLVGFTDKLDGGGTNLAEQIRKILKEDLKYWGVDGKKMGPKLDEDSKNENYMFFQNLKEIKENIESILSLDENEVDNTLSDGHGWALEHMATAKDDIEEVASFLKHRK